jgi:UTP--glucose-1-phosphate uridylyltransferase
MRVRKAVFPAAGLGTRFLPATKAQPKEMLPIVDKPTIQYVVEEAVASGLPEIIIVTGRNKRAIEDHFDAAFELEYYLNDRGKVEELAQIKTISELASVSYVRQKEPLGLGHAILCARPLVGEEPFAVFLGDDIIGPAGTPCMRQLLDVFERYGGPVIAVERVPRERIHQYGVIAARHIADNVYEISDLVEKPKASEAPSDLAIIGRYVLTPEIFGILAETAADTRGRSSSPTGCARSGAGARCMRWSSRASATTPATSSASSRPPWSSPSPGPTSPTSSARTCACCGSDRAGDGALR